MERKTDEKRRFNRNMNIYGDWWRERKTKKSHVIVDLRVYRFYVMECVHIESSHCSVHFSSMKTKKRKKKFFSIHLLSASSTRMLVLDVIKTILCSKFFFIFSPKMMLLLFTIWSAPISRFDQKITLSNFKNH